MIVWGAQRSTIRFQSSAASAAAPAVNGRCLHAVMTSLSTGCHYGYTRYPPARPSVRPVPLDTVAMADELILLETTFARSLVRSFAVRRPPTTRTPADRPAMRRRSVGRSAAVFHLHDVTRLIVNGCTDFLICTRLRRVGCRRRRRRQRQR